MASDLIQNRISRGESVLKISESGWNCFMEKKILRAAHAYEKARGDFGTPEEGGKKA